MVNTDPCYRTRANGCECWFQSRFPQETTMPDDVLHELYSLGCHSAGVAHEHDEEPDEHDDLYCEIGGEG